MKKKTTKYLILIIIGLPILIIGGITIVVLGAVARYSAQLPDPSPEAIRLIDKPYLCKLAKEKNFSVEISDYDPGFPTHKGIKPSKFGRNLSQCLSDKSSSYTPYTIEEIFSLKFTQSHLDEQIEGFFQMHIKECKEDYIESMMTI